MPLLLSLQSVGHSKTNHNQLYLFPDGTRYESLPSAAKVGVPGAWGASCAQPFAPMVDDSGWDERYYNNTCIMQSSGYVYSFPDSCDATTPAFQSVMPLVANNTFYTPSATPFTLQCLVNGTSQQLDFKSWQALGKDVGSVQLVATSSTLTKLLKQAAEMLGMSEQRSPSQPQPRVRVE